MEAYITSWFNTKRSNELSPNQTVGLISRAFLKFIQNIEYDIVDFKSFQRRLCTAVCALQERRMTGKPLRLNMLNYQNFDLPPDWNREKELAWFDYHRVNVFDASFWIDFWEQVPLASWENIIGNWRLELQDIMIQSVDRENSILSKKCGFRTNDAYTPQDITQEDNETYMSD
jgi:hypothetical protein